MLHTSVSDEVSCYLQQFSMADALWSAIDSDDEERATLNMNIND